MQPTASNTYHESNATSNTPVRVYLAYLVQKEVFTEVYIDFLPVGKTCNAYGELIMCSLLSDNVCMYILGALESMAAASCATRHTIAFMVKQSIPLATCSANH